MDAFSVCQASCVWQIVILKNRIHIVLNIEASVLLTSSVLDIPVSYENRRRRFLELHHHNCPPQRLLLLAVLAHLILRLRSDVEVCADVFASDKTVTG